MFELTDHRLDLPLDYSKPHVGTIEVFAREVTPPGGANLPVLVYLQGGPGHESPRPSARLGNPAWLARALQDYRVLFLDQRGTGLSTPFGLHTLAAFDHSATDAAEYLTHFRADSIVQDSERFREHLGLDQLSLLGQSFGGFTSLHYLTAASASLREVYFTGGLPPVGLHCDDVYRATFRTQRIKNQDLYSRFPSAKDHMRRAVEACNAGNVHSRSGRPLTARLLRTVGSHLGFTGGAQLLANLLERDPRSPAFVADVSSLLPFKGRNPLYSVIHESSYADGCVTGWSSDRVMPDDFKTDETLFTSEHLFPWHFVDDPDLEPYQEVAEQLSQYQWPKLYEAEKLAVANVPCAAAIYTTDPFVDVDFSRHTAALLPNIATWETPDHDHNALRIDGGKILDELFKIIRT